MKTDFIPPELFSSCLQTVEKFHQERGFDSLAARIETPQNLDILKSLPEAAALLSGTNRYFAIRKWCFFGSIGIVCLAFLIPWWSLSALVLIFLADKFLSGRERAGWRSLAAVLLSIEMLANDFSGFGTAYPKEKEEALRLLEANPEAPASGWLDYYVPGRMAKSEYSASASL